MSCVCVCARHGWRNHSAKLELRPAKMGQQHTVQVQSPPIGSVLTKKIGAQGLCNRVQLNGSKH